jgi:hypothetical protein
MMTYDPYQTYPVLGQNYGMTTPIGSPYTGPQPWASNPAALINPLAAALAMTSNQGTGAIPQTGQPSYPGYSNQGGINPQQLQLASLLASQAVISQLLGISPWATGLANPLLATAVPNNNPLLPAALQNPQLNAILAAFGHSMGQQSGYQPNSIYGQTGSPYGQQTASPFGQTPSPYGQQIGSPFGQTGSPFGQVGTPLPPQSWIGQGGPFGGQQFGQGNPLQTQFGGRPFQTSGMSPWGY